MSFFRCMPAVLAGCFALAAHARDTDVSTAQVQAHADAFEITITYTMADVERMLPSSFRLGTDSSQDTITSAKPELDQLAALLWEVRVGGEPLALRECHIAFSASDDLAFRLIYPRPEAVSVFFRAAELASLPPNHREHFTYLDEQGRVRIARTLTARSDSVEISLLATGGEPVASAAMPEEPALRPRVSRGFFQLGVQCILTRCEHLLFLFGLLVVCRSFKSLSTTLASFTLACSLTLALATFDIVNPSSRFIEPMIAASIVFVGIENLLRPGADPRGRWLLMLVFGLIHGFGFASVLHDLRAGADGSGLVQSLVTFDLGLAVGQIAIAAAVLPVVWWLRRNQIFLHRGVPVLSSLVVAGGLYWMLGRTLPT